MFGVSASVNLPLHHKVQKFSSGTGSPGWSRKKGHKTVVCACVCQTGCLPYFHTWCGLNANLECRCEMCCTQLPGNAGPKKSPEIHHLGTIEQLCWAIPSQILPGATFTLRPSLVLSFRVLAALLHGTRVVGISQSLRR